MVQLQKCPQVCRHCFVRLGNQFEKFVKTKVGESCGLAAKAVDLSEYTISFNSSTMNIEADPKQHSYVQEFVSTVLFLCLSLHHCLHASWRGLMLLINSGLEIQLENGSSALTGVLPDHHSLPHEK